MTRLLILASQSTARARLLADAGVVFEARPAQLDEDSVKAAARADGAAPGDVAMALAVQKASRVQQPGAVVIGADQMLVCDGRWFDKPPTLDAARDQLLALRGRRHELVTAVTCLQDGTEIWRHLARPVLTMRAFSDEYLVWYLNMEGMRVTESVGAYRLEGPGIQLFDAIEGEFSAVLGLPLLPLLQFLRQYGVLPT